MEPSEKDNEPQVTAHEAPAPDKAPPPRAEEPITDDLISSEVPPKLTVEDAEPPVPVSPDLAAVEPVIPSTEGTPTNLDLPAGGSGPAQGTNLDLPGIELPHPAYPEPQPVPPIPAAYQTPGQAYGQTPYAVPEPPPAPAYGQQYSQPPQSGYAAQVEYAPQYSGQQLAYPTGELSASDENVWSAAAHWSALLASVIGLGFLGPLIVMLTQGTKSARVRANAVESLNFEITFIISMIVSVLLMLLIIGFITTPLLGLAWLVLRIIAAVQTSSGQDYRYPVNIRLVK